MAVKTSVAVKEIMRTHVYTLPASMPVRQAIQTLEENEITGAPVTDRAGRIVGFLSVRDIARTEHLRNERLDAEQREHMFTQRFGEDLEENPFDEDMLDKEDYSPEVLGGELVEDWMNPDVISTSPEASLREVCRLIIKEKIHRVLVVEQGTLQGIVTTTDIVRYLAEA